MLAEALSASWRVRAASPTLPLTNPVCVLRLSALNLFFFHGQGCGED